MSRYYPKSYRKKRRQERMQRAIGFTVTAVIVVGLGVVVAWFVYKSLVPGTPEEGTDNLVLLADEMEKEKIEEEASLNPPPESPPPSAAEPTDGPEEQKTITLDDIKEFEKSFPEIGITLLSASGDALGRGSVGAEEDISTEVDGSEVVPDEDEEDERPSPPGGAESVRPGPPVSRPPADTEADSSLERQDTPDETESESGAEEGGDESAGAGSGGASGDYVFAVYAGKWGDEGEAKRKLSELTGIGYAGRIREKLEEGKTNFYIIVEEGIAGYEKAKDIQGDLKKKGFSSAFVTKKQKP